MAEVEAPRTFRTAGVEVLLSGVVVVDFEGVPSEVRPRSLRTDGVPEVGVGVATVPRIPPDAGGTSPRVGPHDRTEFGFWVGLL